MLTELVTNPFVPNDTDMGLEAGRIQVKRYRTPQTTLCVLRSPLRGISHDALRQHDYGAAQVCDSISRWPLKIIL